MRLVEHLKRQPGDAIVVAIAVAGQVDVRAGLDDPPPGLSVLVLAWTLVLLARRRFPLAAPLTTWTLIVLGAFVWEQEVEDGYYALLSIGLAGYWLGAANERRRAVAGGLAAFALAQLANRQFADGTVSASDEIFRSAQAGASSPITSLSMVAATSTASRAGRSHGSSRFA